MFLFLSTPLKDFKVCVTSGNGSRFARRASEVSDISFFLFFFLWLCPPDLDFTQQLATTLRNKWLVFSFLQEITWRCSCAHMTVWTMAGEINEGTVRQTSHAPLDTTLWDRFVIVLLFYVSCLASRCQSRRKLQRRDVFLFLFFWMWMCLRGGVPMGADQWELFGYMKISSSRSI